MVARLFTPRVCALLLVMGAVVAYLPTLNYPPVYEDSNDPARYTERPPFIMQVANPSRVLSEVAIDAGRWLTPGSFRGQHLINLALLALNSWLLWRLASLLLPPLGAVVAVAVFALHPMQTEAVAYVAARSELVAGSGVLLALWATSVGSLTGAVVGCVVASLSKESAVMAWAVVPLWALLTPTTFPVRRFVLIALGAIAICLWRLSDVLGMAGVSLDQMGRTATSVMGLVSLLVAPLWQSIDHDWRGVPIWLQSVAVGALVSLTVAALWSPRRWASLAWLVAVLWFLPRFVVHATEGLHEHHVSSAVLVGWSLCVGGWASSSQLNHARV